jgi:hypothetical protein
LEAHLAQMAPAAGSGGWPVAQAGQQAARPRQAVAWAALRAQPGSARQSGALPRAPSQAAALKQVVCPPPRRRGRVSAGAWSTARSPVAAAQRPLRARQPARASSGRTPTKQSAKQTGRKEQRGSRAARIPPNTSRHLQKPMSSRMEPVVVRSAFELSQMGRSYTDSPH